MLLGAASAEDKRECPCTSYNAVMVRILVAMLLVVLLTAVGRTQTPQPFPRAGSTSPQRPSAPAPAPKAPAPVAPTPQPGPIASSAVSQIGKVDPNAPSAEVLGVTVFPGAQFLGSYDAGRGQRYYLFGTTAGFVELTTYYRTATGERGDLVFKDPPTHMFTGGTLARYREETMAFPPSVTVKDWTSGGAAGYLNPKRGTQPERFPTVIMIVPPPASTSAPR